MFCYVGVVGCIVCVDSCLVLGGLGYVVVVV